MTFQERCDRELAAQTLFDSTVKGMADLGYEINVDASGDLGFFLLEKKAEDVMHAQDTKKEDDSIFGLMADIKQRSETILRGK